MKIKEFRFYFVKQLTPLYGIDEATSFFYIILYNIHQLKRTDLALQPDLEMSKLHYKMWNAIISELKTYKPIQYILGETHFFGLRLKVDENTLIPRPETEELVQLILDNPLVHTTKNTKILDIGTGSGCIAIALAKNCLTATVFALDVSEKALDVAKSNATSNQVVVSFAQMDILKTAQLGDTFDVIVSNPPYVRQLEKTEIHKNVLHFEPHLALFVDDDDPLLFYKKIAHLAQNHLSENGFLYFEINQYLGKETVDMLKNLNFKNVTLYQDVYGNDRMIACTLN